MEAETSSKEGSHESYGLYGSSLIMSLSDIESEQGFTHVASSFGIYTRRM